MWDPRILVKDWDPYLWLLGSELCWGRSIASRTVLHPHRAKRRKVNTRDFNLTIALAISIKVGTQWRQIRKCPTPSSG